jgi:hypothetical protein
MIHLLSKSGSVNIEKYCHGVPSSWEEGSGVVEKNKVRQLFKKAWQSPTTRQALPSFGGVGGGII